MCAKTREQQISEAEELLGDNAQDVGFAKGLFFGRYLHHKLPAVADPAMDSQGMQMAEQLREFCQQSIDPVAIDRNAIIPDEVIRGLGDLGVLGACLPESAGGRGLSQSSYCRLIEILGGHCGSTALFVNAHHSIGPRSIVLFGNEQQQQQWLPKLATGEWISAFALTEPEAGSDAANVQSTATPTEDGRGYLINGQKRWITNGSIAQVLSVMARTPVEGTTDSKITAFIVTPDMQGFEVTEARMSKCGVRGTATSRLAFKDMFVPNENVLGEVGKGLRVALTVLDFGRTTFGASCTGAAKFCVERALRHANSRVQFDQKLKSFELVKQKLANMRAGTYAMEAATYQTAALIDSGAGDYMLETAILKVFATDVLWEIINDTIQIYGGKAYFTDEPFERMMRDARINMIGEGANDVLRAFVALVGMREVGMELQGVLQALSHPLKNFSRLGSFAGKRIESLFRSPDVHLHSAELEPEAKELGNLIHLFASNVEKLLRTYRESIVDRQYHLGRIADAVIEIYVSACVLNRMDRDMQASASEAAHGAVHHSSQTNGHNTSHVDSKSSLALGRYFLQSADRRVRRRLAELWDNIDDATTAVADLLL
ncbi:MAG: acyl-CoA dehydrogenase family protein [Planctomycetota bacterium]|nr:acyl-CoA dehydrogenase family protein [Planctomycetota bacterium]